MVGYTHRKHPYHATCVQWDGKNTKEILELLNGNLVEPEFKDDFVMLRFRDQKGRLLEITTLYIGDWIRRGENGVIKRFKPEEFALRYEAIPVPA